MTESPTGNRMAGMIAALPMTYYHVPGLTKVSLSGQELLELFQKVPTLVGLKYSDADLFTPVLIKKYMLPIRVILGSVHTLRGGLALGRGDGAVGAL